MALTEAADSCDGQLSSIPEDLASGWLSVNKKTPSTSGLAGRADSAFTTKPHMDEDPEGTNSWRDVTIRRT
jgi:hypothetical protein